MRIKRIELEKFLGELLTPHLFQDYGPNGLQVQGSEYIEKISFAVSATADSIGKAAKFKSDALIVHHGIYWRYQGVKTLTGPFLKRVKPLIDHQMNLFAYHLPLDAHLEVGNAATLAKKIGLKNLKPFGEHKKMPLGVMGSFDTPLSQDEFSKNLERILNHPVIKSSHDDNKKISTLGIITGGANNDWPYALKENLDAYLTGEISEYNWHDAKEAEIIYFAGGHHATEQFGVIELKNKIKEYFNLNEKDLFYIDSDNPA